jgi:hypothetical protein
MGWYELVIMEEKLHRLLMVLLRLWWVHWEGQGATHTNRTANDCIQAAVKILLEKFGIAA